MRKYTALYDSVNYSIDTLIMYSQIRARLTLAHRQECRRDECLSIERYRESDKATPRELRLLVDRYLVWIVLLLLSYLFRRRG